MLAKLSQCVHSEDGVVVASQGVGKDVWSNVT